MSTNSLSAADIEYDLKTLQKAVENLGQILKPKKNTSVGKQQSGNPPTSQKKTNNSSPLEDPHQQTAKVIKNHAILSNKLKNNADFSTDFEKEIDNHPNLSDDQKNDIKGDHQYNKNYLDKAGEHLNSAKEKLNYYPISKLHLKNASTNLNEYQKGAMAVINKFGNAITTSSKDTINKTTQALRNKLSSTKNGQTKNYNK